jgi:hypothetical protein
MSQTPQEFALQAVKGIKMSFDNGMSNKLDQYVDNRMIAMYPTDEVFEIFTSTEGMTGSKKLARRETPPVLKLEDGYSVQIQENTFGGAIEVPFEDYKRWQQDSTLKVDQYLMRERNALMNDNTHKFLSEAFTFLNYAFVTTYYAAPDTYALCSATHTWKTTGASTFDNYATKAMSMSAIEDLEEYGGRFTLADGKEFPIDFDTIIVKKGSQNEREAIKLFAKDIKPTAVADINIYQGSKTIVSTPYISYANRNYWFARASQLDNSLKIGIGMKPTLQEPIRQNNEAIRTNCMGIWKQGIVNMPFDWYGSDGTT